MEGKEMKGLQSERVMGDNNAVANKMFSNSTSPREEKDITRRKFLLKTGIASILMSLGLPALEELVAGIIRRMAEHNGNSEFAHMIDDNLSHEAFALDCPENHACDNPPTGFNCQFPGFSCSNNHNCNIQHQCFYDFNCLTAANCVESHTCDALDFAFDCATFDCGNYHDCSVNVSPCSCSFTGG